MGMFAKYNHPVDGEKFCNRCERTLPLRAFYKDSSTFSGRKSRCKDCLIELALEWTAAHWVHVLRMQRLRYRAHSGEVLRRRRQTWRQRHPRVREERSA